MHYAGMSKLMAQSPFTHKLTKYTYQSEASWFWHSSTNFLYRDKRLSCIKLYSYWSSCSYEQISWPLSYWNLTYKRHYRRYQEFKDRLCIQDAGNIPDCIVLYPDFFLKSILGHGKDRMKIHRHSKHASRFGKYLHDIGNKMHTQASIWKIIKTNYSTLCDPWIREIYVNEEIIISKKYEFPSMVSILSITALGFIS